MLILSRKKEESIMIRDNIEIIVVDIDEGKVKLGIRAPKDIEIYRKEIYEEIQKSNREAVNSKQIDFNSLKHIFGNEQKNFIKNIKVGQTSADKY